MRGHGEAHGTSHWGQKLPKMTFYEIEACNSIFYENFQSIIKICQVGCTYYIISKLVAEKCICRGRGVIHGGAKMGQNHPKSMTLTSHVVLVLERSCYGWGHIMRMSDNIFVNKSRYGVMGSPMSRHKW